MYYSNFAYINTDLKNNLLHTHPDLLHSLAARVLKLYSCLTRKQTSASRETLYEISFLCLSLTLSSFINTRDQSTGLAYYPTRGELRIQHHLPTAQDIASHPVTIAK